MLEWAAAGGACMAMGLAINAHLRQYAGPPIVPAAVNFVVGAVVLGVACAVTGEFAGAPGVAHAPPWALLGGALGAIYVTLSLIVIPRVGLAATAMSIVFGQLAGSMVLDRFHWLGASGAIGWNKVVAAILVLIAVVLVNRKPQAD